MIPMAAVVFVLLPRARSTGFLNNLGSGAMVQTGYTDLVQFHEFGQLTESDEEVMTVTLTRHGTRENVGSEVRPYYCRGQPLDTYAGRSRSNGIPPPLLIILQCRNNTDHRRGGWRSFYHCKADYRRQPHRPVNTRSTTPTRRPHAFTMFTYSRLRYRSIYL